jgi:hypothetical protein
MPRRTLTLLLVLLAAVALAACGDKKAVTLHGDTEGEYVDVGPMKYQVQVSRLLNPFDPEDRGYLIDLPAGQSLGPKDDWFAVFMRVENGSENPGPVATQYEIVDTQDNKYTPVEMGRKNVFAYRPGTLGAHQVLPFANSPAGQNTIQGAMLLFKIPVENFANRPLELRISPPPGAGTTVGTIDLDV